MKEEAVIYARVSSSKQISEGHGNESQIQSGKKLIEFKNWKFIRSFQEDGISGATTKRPAMQEMIAFLKQRHQQGKITTVIIDDLKRFSRDIGGYIELKELVVACGAKLASPKFNFEDSPEGEFFELLTVLTGQLERKQNRRQVIDRMKSRLEMGYWPFPATPPGYTLSKIAGHGKIMCKNEPEASIYTEALEGYASGRFPNQISIKNFLEWRLNKKFTVQNARNALDRAFIYAGYVDYPKWGVTRRKGQHDALISLETCLQIQERLHGSLRKNTRKDINPEFPLRGRVRCVQCNKVLRAAWCRGRSDKYPKYWCSNKTCSLYSVTAERKNVEGDFEEILQSIKPQERTLKAVEMRTIRRWDKKISEATEYHQSLVNKTTGISDQVKMLVNRIGTTSNETVATALEKRIEDLELERLALEEKQAKYKPDNFDYRTALQEVIDFIKDPHKRWQSRILAQQHLVLDICFAKDLEYHPKEGYRTAQLSPTFRYLNQYNEILESVSETQLQGSGHGRNRLEHVAGGS